MRPGFSSFRREDPIFGILPPPPPPPPPLPPPPPKKSGKKFKKMVGEGDTVDFGDGEADRQQIKKYLHHKLQVSTIPT